VLSDTLAYAVGRRVYKYNASVQTGLSDTEPQPPAFVLDQNYPNPFGPSTRIGYSLTRRTNVRLRVFDVAGRQIRTLLNASQGPGRYDVDWDGEDDVGRPVASGMYLYVIDAGESPEMKTMVLIR
ncbi:MAG: FlgD immunoglobulin-like domain containing protein, partial [Rhodothermales bacterium]|nr:FlgD immunoglobulin-like domain containing protein [Rhodothermales bacterium]